MRQCPAVAVQKGPPVLKSVDSLLEGCSACFLIAEQMYEQPLVLYAANDAWL